MNVIVYSSSSTFMLDLRWETFSFAKVNSAFRDVMWVLCCDMLVSEIIWRGEQCTSSVTCWSSDLTAHVCSMVKCPSHSSLFAKMRASLAIEDHTELVVR
jgi:hypothetical protein